MISIKDKKECSGCTACASVCPHNAIQMQPDVLGFLYPVIDADLCVECGLCDKVCQFNNKYSRYNNFETPMVYGSRHKEEKELEISQSGAASWAIMQCFLEQSGVVYGVGYDDLTHIVHKRAVTIEDCEEFRGSKYVQSDLRNIFDSIKKDLISGQRVLFFGTACQVAGLKAFIPKKLHSSLTTVDLVCHAVPSPAVWKSYIEYFENKQKAKVINVNFRNKKYGWHSHSETILFNNGTEITSDTYFDLFYKHLTIRPSCSNCHFTNFNRVSDVTIGDFWGWEKSYSDWNDNKGVSLFMVNSQKGLELRESLKKYMEFIESDVAKCSQPQLRGPVELHKDYMDVVALFEKSGFEGVAKKYGYIPGYKYYLDRVKGKLNYLRSVLSRIKHKLV